MKKKYIPLEFSCTEITESSVIATSGDTLPFDYATKANPNEAVMSKGSNLLNYSFDDSDDE